MATGAAIMCKCLEKENIQVVFGYPGAAICPFYDALAKTSIRHILVRQEQNGGHAASGYARISGRPAVCIATSGPGATNLVTALAAAYMDSIPIIAITGQVSSELLGRDVFQEADITGACEPFTKHSFLVKEAADLPRVFKEAFYIAGTGRPGPVLIDVPIDVQRQKAKFSYPQTVDIRGYKPTLQGHAVQVKKVAKAIANSEKPLLCVGGGVLASRAQQEVMQLSEKCGIPAVSTMMGLGIFSPSCKNYLGMIGLHGCLRANRALLESDLLIIVGARVGDRAISTPGLLEKKAAIVHIDIDPAEIGKNLVTSIPLVGDAKHVIGQLLQIAEPAQHTQWIEKLLAIQKPLLESQPPDNGFVHPLYLLSCLNARLHNNAVVVTDVGQNQIWAANCFGVEKGSFLTSGGMGAMGYALGAAIGAKLAAPERQVVCVCGDGSFQMSFMELATLYQHNIDIKIILINNGCLGLVKQEQKQCYSQCFGVDLAGSPDFIQIAKAYGIQAARVTENSQVKNTIEKFLSWDGPAILECRINSEEENHIAVIKK